MDGANLSILVWVLLIAGVPLISAILISIAMYYSLPQIYERYTGYSIYFRVYSERVHFYWKKLPEDEFMPIWRKSTIRIAIIQIAATLMLLGMVINAVSENPDPWCTFCVFIGILLLCLAIMVVQSDTLDELEEAYRKYRREQEGTGLHEIVTPIVAVLVAASKSAEAQVLKKNI